MIELLDVVNLPTSLQKRLEQVRKANEGQEIGRKLKQIGALYGRLLKDSRRSPEWHDLSLEMILPETRRLSSDSRRRLGTPNSPPPEEIRFKMPDISALHVHDHSVRDSVNDDVSHLNLDDYCSPGTHKQGGPNRSSSNFLHSATMGLTIRPSRTSRRSAGRRPSPTSSRRSTTSARPARCGPSWLSPPPTSWCPSSRR